MGTPTVFAVNPRIGTLSTIIGITPAGFDFVNNCFLSGLTPPSGIPPPIYNTDIFRGGVIFAASVSMQLNYFAGGGITVTIPANSFYEFPRFFSNYQFTNTAGGTFATITRAIGGNFISASEYLALLTYG